MKNKNLKREKYYCIHLQLCRKESSTLQKKKKSAMQEFPAMEGETYLMIYFSLECTLRVSTECSAKIIIIIIKSVPNFASNRE